MMGANVSRTAALMPRRNNSISKLMKNHHYNNNNMQSLRSYSYKFDPPTSSNNKVTLLLGVGLGFTAGILIGGFGMHVDVLPASTVIGFGPPRERDYSTQLIATSMTLSEMIVAGVFLALAAQNSQAPEIAAERYLTAAANNINIRCMTNPTHPKNQLNEIKKALSQLKRLVFVKCDNEKSKVYELLKYDDDGMSCVVKGPIHLGSGPDQGRDGYLLEDSYEGAKVITVKRNDVYFMNKTPVECQGLVGEESHLNGKIGTVCDKKDDDVLVSFADPALRKEWVPRGDLRVVNKLPLIREDVSFPMVPPFTPVICQGLKFEYEKHLNNKIGTVLNVDYENNSAMVTFEDPNLPDTKVHVKNLFLSKELPTRFMDVESKDKRG